MSFGYDCSGYIQMLFRQMSIHLPRNSYQQCDWKGFMEIPIEKTLPGDLYFFGFAKNEIKHVGLALGNQQFIHTCAAVENMPYLRISSLQDHAWNGSGYYPYSTARRLIIKSLQEYQ